MEKRIFKQDSLGIFIGTSLVVLATLAPRFLFTIFLPTANKDVSGLICYVLVSLIAFWAYKKLGGKASGLLAKPLIDLRFVRYSVLGLFLVVYSILGSPINFGRSLMLLIELPLLFLIGWSEELIYRGYIFSKILRVWPKIAPALSSFIFTLAHVPNLLIGDFSIIDSGHQLVFVFSIGYFLSVLRVILQNLWMPIFLHCFLDLPVFFGVEEASGLLSKQVGFLAWASFPFATLVLAVLIRDRSDSKK